MQVRLPRNTAATLSQFVICGILRQPLLARQPLAAERLAQRVQQVVIDQFDELRALGIGLWQSFDLLPPCGMPSVLQDASAISSAATVRSAVTHRCLRASLIIQNNCQKLAAQSQRARTPSKENSSETQRLGSA